MDETTSIHDCYVDIACSDAVKLASDCEKMRCLSGVILMSAATINPTRAANIAYKIIHTRMMYICRTAAEFVGHGTSASKVTPVIPIPRYRVGRVQVHYESFVRPPVRHGSRSRRRCTERLVAEIRAGGRAFAAAGLWQPRGLRIIYCFVIPLLTCHTASRMAFFFSHSWSDVPPLHLLSVEWQTPKTMSMSALDVPCEIPCLHICA